jgi:hypothetical protein
MYALLSNRRHQRTLGGLPVGLCSAALYRRYNPPCRVASDDSPSFCQGIIPGQIQGDFARNGHGRFVVSEFFAVVIVDGGAGLQTEKVAHHAQTLSLVGGSEGASIQI